MRRLAKSLGLGALVGIAVAGVLTSPAWLPALASENVVAPVLSVATGTSASTYDPESLIKYEDRTYSVTYDDSVVQEPTRQLRIKKIEYGRVSFVDIAETASGTYSTEAMFSPHVRYTGITVKRVRDEQTMIRLFDWSNTSGWTELRLGDAGSFRYLQRTGHLSMVLHN